MAAKEIPESMQNKCQTKPKITFKMTVLQKHIRHSIYNFLIYYLVAYSIWLFMKMFKHGLLYIFYEVEIIINI